MTKDVFIKEVRDAEAMLYHISKSILKNDSDCGDAVQETIRIRDSCMHFLKWKQTTVFL